MESWLREGRRGSTAGVMRGPYVIWEGKTSAERHNYCSVESLVQTTGAPRGEGSRCAQWPGVTPRPVTK
jgi:hypothetical protein